MRKPWCQTFLAFILKFLNFLQAFTGVSITVYSFYMLNQWQRRRAAPPAAPSPQFPAAQLVNLVGVSDEIATLGFSFSGLAGDLNFNFNSLPAPCSKGHSLDDSVPFFVTVILDQIKIAVFSFNYCVTSLGSEFGGIHFAGSPLGKDPTGELASLCNFIEDNIDVCKWVGIVVIIIQALSLLLAIILRALANQRVDIDIEGGSDVREGSSLAPCLNRTSGLTQGGSRSGHSDIWSLRLREKVSA
nr:tetraspanin-18-like isoform X1 [Ipomoea batatas]